MKVFKLIFSILVCEAFGFLMLHHMFIRVASIDPIEDSWFNAFLFMIALTSMYVVPSLMIKQHEEECN